MNGRIGFTLIELIVSLAISAMLLVSVMGLSARLSVAAKSVRENHPTENWKSVLQHRLASDFLNARSVVVRPNEIVFDAKGIPANNKTNDGFLLAIPMQIRYSIRSDDTHSVLVREETPLVTGHSSYRNIAFLATGIVSVRSETPLATDVAPGTMKLQLFQLDEETPIKFSLVRHGMPE